MWKSVEYHPNGRIRRVEYADSGCESCDRLRGEVAHLLRALDEARAYQESER